MTDHDSAHLPVGEHADHGIAASDVEIVGRLVKENEIRFGDEQPGECDPRTLAAGKRYERSPRRNAGEADFGECGVQPGFQRPVGLRRIVQRAVAFGEPGEAGQGVAHTEEIGNGDAVRDLHGLAEHGDAAGAFHRAPGGCGVTGDDAHQCRLADAVAADEAGAIGAEGDIKIVEKWLAVRRCEADGVERHDGRESGWHDSRP